MATPKKLTMKALADELKAQRALLKATVKEQKRLTTGSDRFLLPAEAINRDLAKRIVSVLNELDDDIAAIRGIRKASPKAYAKHFDDCLKRINRQRRRWSRLMKSDLQIELKQVQENHPFDPEWHVVEELIETAESSEHQTVAAVHMPAYYFVDNFGQRQILPAVVDIFVPVAGESAEQGSA